MKFLDLNGVSILWQRIKETFARKSETISEISRDDTTFTVTRADGTTFEFDQKDTTYENATTTTAGLMSATDKAKLNGVEEGAQKNIIESISVNDVEQQVTSKGVNIAIPTSLSQLSDDVGYLTEESDPTVPEWAKQSQKPAYTASEVGALPADTDIPSKVSDLENDADYVSFEDIPVKTVNGKTGDVILSIPSKISDLTDDSDFATNGDLAELQTKLNTLANSDDQTLDQLSEIVAYIKNNKNLIDGITTGKVSVSDIVDNLTSTVTNKPLSAKQGKALKDLIDAIVIPTNVSAFTNDAGYLTEHQDISGKQDVISDLATIRSGAALGATALQAETDPTVPAWAKAATKPSYTAAEVGALPSDTYIPTKVSDLANDAGYLTQHQDISGKANTADLAAVATSGSYNDLSNKPTIPTVPTKVSAFTNDASYTNKQYVDNAITAALADVVGIEYRICGEGEYDAQTFLPTIEGKAGVIYLVPKPLYLIGDATVESATVSGNNIYYEFIYNGNSFKMIGDTSASLDGYLNEDDVSEDSEVQTMLTQVFGGE